MNITEPMIVDFFRKVMHIPGIRISHEETKPERGGVIIKDTINVDNDFFVSLQKHSYFTTGFYIVVYTQKYNDEFSKAINGSDYESLLKTLGGIEYGEKHIFDFINRMIS